jgi:hypothetical protein
LLFSGGLACPLERWAAEVFSTKRDFFRLKMAFARLARLGADTAGWRSLGAVEELFAVSGDGFLVELHEVLRLDGLIAFVLTLQMVLRSTWRRGRPRVIQRRQRLLLLGVARHDLLRIAD